MLLCRPNTLNQFRNSGIAGLALSISTHTQTHIVLIYVFRATDALYPDQMQDIQHVQAGRESEDSSPGS
jgi:hypothetical protein